VSRVRVAFLGTPDFAKFCLEGLIKDEHFEVVGVVTQPDRPAGRNMKMTPSPVKTVVTGTPIPVLTAENVNTPEAIAEIVSWRAEVAVVVAFGQILKQELLDLFPRKIVNVHTSILPRWRGAAPIQRAVMAGDEVTGVSLQVMVRKLDAGDVLGIRKLALTEAMNAFDVHEALKPLAVELLSENLMDYLRGNLVPEPQDESLVTYASKIEKAEAKIDWTLPAVRIVNLIRGLGMGPTAQCRRNDALLKIHRAKLAPSRKGSPGTVVHVDAGSFTVACGEQAIEVIEVQPESRSRMRVEEYLKGYPISAGEILQ
jgi:methionyl-tRNA formyltransferase